MKVLVTGATGTVGSAVVGDLLKRGAGVRAFTRKQPQPGVFDSAVEVAIGDLLDPQAVAAAMDGVDKLFLLNAVMPDELTQALIPIGLAKRAKLKHVTYFSVFKPDPFPDVPHFASKMAVEKALAASDLSWSLLRPGYFFQNDLALKDPITRIGLYPQPIGETGIAALDVRDIAEAAAITLLEDGHAGRAYDLVGPENLSGPGAARVWSGLLGKEVRYAGHDFDAWESQMRSFMPDWAAFDLRSMFQAFHERGFASDPAQVDRFTKLLGRAPRSYADFAAETFETWSTAR